MFDIRTMGQQEVYDFLKNNPKSWFTSKEISTELGISIGSITACLKKLRKTETISYENTGNRNEFKYRYKDEEAERKKLERKMARAAEKKKAERAAKRVAAKKNGTSIKENIIRSKNPSPIKEPPKALNIK